MDDVAPAAPEFAPEPRPAPAGAAPHLTVLLPVLNDWAALRLLLGHLDQVLAAEQLVAHILIVDDGSTQAAGTWGGSQFAAIPCVEVLHLRRNLGHQRAVAIGLAWLEAERPETDLVVVMDSDGEDDPRDVPRLIHRCDATGRQSLVFAERAQRSESWTFRVGYHVYRLGHRILTGRSVRVGNFSVIPRPRLVSLVAVSELWNHYAAAAIMSRQPMVTIATARARRLDGRSRMNFVALVVHGLSAISVHSADIGVRLLIATTVMIGLDLAALGATLLVRILTDRAIPGWATTVFGVLLIILLQATLFLVVFSVVILAGRAAGGFLPTRDFRYYIGSRREVYRR